jgi:Methyltransferase domain
MISSAAKVVLHVGCGRETLPVYLRDCKEVRLDINPDTGPDIVADMVRLPAGIGPFDLVFSCHSLEHLYPYDVVPCLEGFARVLNRGSGHVMIIVPDLEGVSPDDTVLYDSPAGPVTGLDMFYGHSPHLREHPHMAHHCGFVQSTLRKVLEAAGFVDVKVMRCADDGVFYRSLVGVARVPA